MSDFLLEVCGHKSEDLTTEVLRFILTQPEFKPYQRLFYNYLFGNCENKCTDEYRFEIKTQSHFGELGIPDIVICDSSNQAYIIENKFYAEFSRGDQINRYKEILSDEFERFKIKKVFVLTLKSRIPYYRSKVKKSKMIPVEYRQWDKILELFESDNFVTTNLKAFIENNFLRPIDFTKGELAMLTNKEIPAAIDKLFNIIKQVRDQLSENHIAERLSQSRNFVGFYTGTKKRKLWFGYFFQLWSEENPLKITTPIYIQVKKEWLSDVNFSEQHNDEFMKHGYFIEDKFNFEYIKPVPVNDLKQIDKLISFIDNEINFLTGLN